MKIEAPCEAAEEEEDDDGIVHFCGLHSAAMIHCIPFLGLPSWLYGLPGGTTLPRAEEAVSPIPYIRPSHQLTY